jgi:hypothetical protein
MEEFNTSQAGPCHTSTSSIITTPTTLSLQQTPIISTFQVQEALVPYEPVSTTLNTPAPSRGRGLNDTEKRDLIQTCINNQERYGNGTKRAFWQLISEQFSTTNRQYVDYSCQRSVQTMTDKRRREMQIIETGKTQESNPQLNLVLDRWIAIDDEVNQRRENNRRVSRCWVANLQNAHDHRANLISGMNHNNSEAIETSPASSILQTPGEVLSNPPSNTASNPPSNLVSNPSSNAASNLDSTEAQRQRGRAAIQTEADLAVI